MSLVERLHNLFTIKLLRPVFLLQIILSMVGVSLAGTAQASSALYPDHQSADEACRDAYALLPKALWSSEPRINCSSVSPHTYFNDSDYRLISFAAITLIYDWNSDGTRTEKAYAATESCEYLETHYYTNYVDLVSCERRRYYVAINGECPTGFELASNTCHTPPALGEPDAPRACPSPEAGNPINFTNGNKYQKEVDVAFSNTFTSLSLTRHYNSQDKNVGVFGRGWSTALVSKVSSLDIYNVPHADAANTPTKTLKVISTANGRSYEFESVNGVWQSASNVVASLSENNGTWTFENEAREQYTFDGNGKVLSVKNSQDLAQSFTYNTNGDVESISDDFGNTITLTYQNNFIRTASLANHGTYTYGYSGDLLTTISFLSTQPGSTAVTKTYIYDDPNLDYLLTGIIDENNERYATWSYDAQGRGITSEHGDNGAEKVTISYDSDTQSTITNAVGKEKVYTFNKINGIAQISHFEDKQSQNCPLSEQSFTYDTNGFLQTRTDAEDSVTHYQRNARGQVTFKQKGLLWSDANSDGVLSVNELSASSASQIIDNLWHNSFNQKTYQKTSGLDANGIWQDYSSTDVILDTYGRVQSRTLTDLSPYTTPYVTAGRSRTSTYTYSYYSGSAKVETLTINGPREPNDIDGGQDDTSVQYYNLQGLMTQSKNALNQSTYYSNFNALGQPQTITDANNIVTTVSYDAIGYMDTVSIATPQGNAVTDYDYLANGLLRKITLPDLSSLTFTYNAARHLTDIHNHLAEHIALEPHLLNGEWLTRTVKTATGVIWQTSQRVYDELGRVMTLLGNNGQHTDLRYDRNDQLTEVDELGHNTLGTLETRHLYDTLGRLEQSTDAEQHATNFDYDGQNQLVGVTDARQNTTEYIVDGFGETIQEISPDRGTTTYWYDAAGNLTQKTDANTHTLNMTYDALNRIKSQSDDDASNTLWLYDLSDTEHQNSIGRLSSIIETSNAANISSNFSYNALGLSTEQTQTIELTGQSPSTALTTYDYNLAGSLTTITYPSGRLVHYNLLQGQLQSVTTQSNATASTQTLLNSVSHAPFGVIDGYSFGNGLALSKGFDLDGRLDTLILSDGVGNAVNLDYDYDAFNNIKTIDNLESAIRNQSFEYDAVHRLENAQGIYGEFVYDYDAVGNRETRTQTINGRTLLQDNDYKTSNNQIESSTVLVDGVEDSYRFFYYDGAGNIIQRIKDSDFTSFDHNASNRMYQAVTNFSYGKKYLYNALGQKIHSFDPNTVEEEVFIYNQVGQVITILNRSNQTLREYVYLGGERLAMIFNRHLDTSSTVISLYGTSSHTQDNTGVGSISLFSNGSGMTLQGNRWRITNQTFEIASDSYLEFDFESDAQGEVQGIGFNVNTNLNSSQIFNLAGTQNLGLSFGSYDGGVQHYSIPVGSYFTGTDLRLILVNDNDANPNDSSTAISNIKLCSGPCVNAPPTPEQSNSILDLTNNSGYSNQDSSNGSITVDTNNTAMTLVGNRWRYLSTPHTVTSNTYISFDFVSDGLGEVQGIGLDENPVTLSPDRVFKLTGTQAYAIPDYSYTGAGSEQSISIPVGQHFVGDEMYVVLVNDNDGSPSASQTTISNIRLCQGPCPPQSSLAPGIPAIGLEETGTSQIVYIHNDHLSTPQMMTDENQTIVWAADYTPFGELVNGNENLETSRFPGQYFDVATGMYYNYFRDYDPSLGRYIQSDPIGLAGGINTYAYVGGNPVNRIDPFGLEIVATWLKTPKLDFDGGFRRDRDKCVGKAFGDCYYNGSNYGLGVDIYVWAEAMVSEGLLQCEDTETCEEWTVSTDGFYDATNDTLTIPNLLLCSAAKKGLPQQGLPIKTKWPFCPLLNTVDAVTKLSKYMDAARETARQYINDLTPEVRKALCEMGKK